MSSHLDHDALDRLHKLGGRELATKIVDIFLTNAPQKLAAAVEGLKQGELEAVERAVHSLRSSAGNVGANHLAALAEQVEDRAEVGEAGGLDSLLDEMQAEFSGVKEALSKAVEGLES